MSCQVCGGSRWVQAAPVNPPGYHFGRKPAVADWANALTIPCWVCGFAEVAR